MSVYTLPLAVVLAVFAGFAGIATLVQQRREIRHLRALLDHTEQSRRALAEQLLALQRQVDADRALFDDDDGADDAASPAARRADLARLLDVRDRDSQWLETQPAAGPPSGFMPTQPFEIDVDVELDAPAR